MRVFVAGATGAIGPYLIPRLVAAGHEVTGSTRSPSKASQLTNAGATPAVVDGLDRQGVLDAVRAAQPDVIVLRYGMFYGPGASDSMLEVVRKRRMPVVGGGTGIWSFIEITDAAAATAAAVTRGAPGVYKVVDDDPAAVAQWLPYLSECLGVKPPVHAPAWLGQLLAGELVVSLMTEARGASNAKAKRELGWTPRYPSWRDGFPVWTKEAHASAA